MAKFHVTGAVYASKYLGMFEAATAQDAVEMALNSKNAYVSLCHQCAGECSDPEVESAEAEEVTDAE